MEAINKKEDNYPDYMEDFQRLMRFINSGVNAFLYAATRKVYRCAFKFLLTTPPWEWRELARWMLKMETISKEKVVPSVLYSPSRSVVSSPCVEIDTQPESESENIEPDIEEIDDCKQPSDLDDTCYLEAENIVSFNFRSLRGSVMDIANQLWPEIKHPEVDIAN